MEKQRLTLGSLFDGSGGFPLGGLLCGIEPLWSSEVEPFPIRVTTKRMPEVQHFGDINKINGAAVPPVDILTGGFCCQDLSVAGKRAGLHGERSGLFFQIIRIVEEMLEATNGEYPKFVVLENVPGMYSSGKGSDYLEVLNELIKIKDKTLSVPMPQDGKWSTTGEIVGDGFSLGWRTFDAQFWGVAQRRRRCYIVLDLTGERAGKILFDETRLRGNPPQGICPRQATAGDAPAGAGSAMCLNDQGGGFMDISDDVTGTLRAQEHGHQPIVFEPGACSRMKSSYCYEGISGTLRANAGDNQAAVVYDARGNGSGDVANTLTGDHQNRVTDYTALAVEPKTLKIRSGCEGGGKGALVQDNLSATLSCNNDQTVFVPKMYGICSQNSNSMKSDNPNSGIYEMDVSRTLDTGACSGNGGQVVVFDGKQVTSKENRSNPQPGDPCHTLASGSADSTVICLEGNGTRPSHKGSGISESGVAFTLNATEQHQVSYAMTTGSYTQVCEEQSPTLMSRDFKDPPVVNQAVMENYQHSGYREVDVGGTLKSHGGTNGGGSENMVVENRYVVRRLTPTECALLQGFPSDWCAGLGTPKPTEDDIAFWSEVWETHRRIVGKSSKPKSRNQIIKWLREPYSDAAEYKMWGNGVCLNNVFFVLSGIVYYAS